MLAAYQLKMPLKTHAIRIICQNIDDRKALFSTAHTPVLSAFGAHKLTTTTCID